jgi:hypothetical protein
VRPSFTPHGPTAPVTLLMDEAGVTQLAGEPVVAWQTPWSEVASLRLMRTREGVSIVAIVAGVLYQWRRVEPMSRAQLDEVRAVLSAHGARELPRGRRNTALAVAAMVTLASFGGYFGGLFNHRATSGAVTALESLNVNARDVGGTWSSSSLASSSLLTSLMPAPGRVQYNNPATTTTAPAQASPFALAAVHFQRCLDVASVDDRLFGLAGTAPRYQVSSPIYYTSDLGGVQVESTAQYYDSPPSVALDVAEMSRPSFGRCFAQSAGDELIGVNTGVTPELSKGQNLATPTFVKGWARGGDVAVSLTSLQVTRAHLVFVEEAAGHYEVTLFALVADLNRARATIINLANALLARVNPTSAVSA